VAGLVFFCLADGVFAKLRAAKDCFVELDLFLKNKTGRSRTAGRLTFVHAATKVSKNAFLLAEGNSFAGFLRHPITTKLNKPARYRGAFLWV
jgi:hypothetical protein